MSSRSVHKHNKRRTIFKFDMSTMEDPCIAPEDEMRGMEISCRKTKPHPEQQLSLRRNYQQQQQQQQHHHHHPHGGRKQQPTTSVHKASYSRNNSKPTKSPTDDENRIPPPMEVVPIPTGSGGGGGGGDVTNSSSNHPKFEAWRRDMTGTFLHGTISTKSPKNKNELQLQSIPPKSSKNRNELQQPKDWKTTRFSSKSKNELQPKDWKTTRINKRRLEKKLLHQKLRSVKSDISIESESGSSDDDHSTDSVESSYSSSFLQSGKESRKDRRVRKNGKFSTKNDNKSSMTSFSTKHKMAVGKPKKAVQAQRSESGHDTHTSSSTKHKDAVKSKKQPVQAPRSESGHNIHTVYIRNDKGSERKAPRHSDSTRQPPPMPQSPRSPRSRTTQRPPVSAIKIVHPVTSPKPGSHTIAKSNSSELATIKVDLADLKSWAEGVIPMMQLQSSSPLRQSTPPSSPTSPRPPLGRPSFVTSSKDAKEKKDYRPESLPKSIVLPPKIIAIPQLVKSNSLQPENKYKNMVVRQVSSMDKGLPIPAVLTIKSKNATPKAKKDKDPVTKAKVDAVMTKPKKEPETKSKKDQPTTIPILKTKETVTTRRKKYSIFKKTLPKTMTKKKRVRFAKKLITEIKYRPKTKREDVDSLYFQEEELMEYEKDEETTPRDRFEVVVNFKSSHEATEDDDGDGADETYTGMLSIGPSVISFHDSRSFSYQDSSDDSSDDGSGYSF